jgi:hypothetical protein
MIMCASSKGLSDTDVLDKCARMRHIAPNFLGVPAPVVRNGLREVSIAGRHIRRVLVDCPDRSYITDCQSVITKCREDVLTVCIKNSLRLSIWKDEDRILAKCGSAINYPRTDTL